ncbi:hypothetical protein ANCCAN_03809 [Ancylostoma caninum]|uniref:Uncharacterized protein n=1 Tax=Ancylostoma caninum TaxID=29170 RepID=A0A368H0U3_ANCCA|nr:hypothetical protein ANCCAN_03809 [Ancylostoma caninum]
MATNSGVDIRIAYSQIRSVHRREGDRQHRQWEDRISSDRGIGPEREVVANALEDFFCYPNKPFSPCCVLNR